MSRPPSIRAVSGRSSSTLLVSGTNAGAASYLAQGDKRGDAAPTSPRPLLGEVFSFQRTFSDDDTEIRAARDRGEVAARLGGRGGVPRRQPGARRARGREPLVPARDAAVPLGTEPAHGACPQLHDGRRPDPRAAAERLACRAPD